MINRNNFLFYENILIQEILKQNTVNCSITDMYNNGNYSIIREG